MKYTFRKYEMATQEEVDEKIALLGVSEEGYPTHGHTIVNLGHIVFEQGVYDEEGNEVTPPVVSDKFHVDVLWVGEPDPAWDENMIWCAPMGIHTFGSSSAIAEWTQKCKELHPEFFPEPEEAV